MEEAKSFDFGSPERIAKFYGGNKQKIFQALQSGALRRFAPAPMDATLAAATADFIDQMRNAAQAEAAPQQTVFEKLFTPPAPPQMPQGMPPMPQGAPAGLGGTPEAATMPPMGDMPPMGAPPQGEMPMMAEGGMVPPYASGGGLSDMPLPDGMFDEPSNGGFGDGYAGGGLIAFAAGDKVVEDEDGDGNPDTYFGYNYKDPLANAARDAALFGVPETKYTQEYEADLLARRTPEARSKRRKEDMWMALGQIGARMAQTPGSIFQAAGAGISEALPGIAASAKERRAEEREIQKGLIDIEQGRNTAAAQKAMRLMQAQQLGIQGREGQIGRAFQKAEAEAGREFTRAENKLDRDLRRFEASLRGSSSSSSSSSGEKDLSDAQITDRVKLAKNAMDTAWAEANAADKLNDTAHTRLKIGAYGKARNIYNYYATLAGLPTISGVPKGLKNFEAAAKRGKPAANTGKPTKTMSLADKIIAG